MPTKFYYFSLVITLPVPAGGAVQHRRASGFTVDGYHDRPGLSEQTEISWPGPDDDEAWLEHLGRFEIKVGKLDSLGSFFWRDIDYIRALVGKGTRVEEESFPLSYCDARVDFEPQSATIGANLPSHSLGMSTGFDPEGHIPRLRMENLLVELSTESGIHVEAKFQVPQDPSILARPVLTNLGHRIHRSTEISVGPNADGTLTYPLDEAGEFAINMPQAWYPMETGSLKLPEAERSLGKIELQYVATTRRSRRSDSLAEEADLIPDDEWEDDWHGLGKHADRRIDAIEASSLEGPSGPITLKAWGEWTFMRPLTDEAAREREQEAAAGLDLRADAENSEEFKNSTLTAAATIHYGSNNKVLVLAVTASIPREHYSQDAIVQLRDWIGEVAAGTQIQRRI